MTSTPDTTFEELQRHVQAASRSRALAADPGDALRPGQVWSLREPTPEELPGWLALVLDIVDSQALTIAPWFRWTELAGPGDLLLPKGAAGNTVAVSIELSCTIGRTALDVCYGRLADEQIDTILQADRALGTGAARHFAWGIDYIDDHDCRHAYHDGIAATLSVLQAAALEGLDLATEAGSKVQDPLSIPGARIAAQLADFPARMAAAGNGQCSRCLICTGEPEPAAIGAADTGESVWVRCIGFETAPPNADTAAVWEWVIDAVLPDQARAAIYDRESECLLGEADLDPVPGNGQTIVTLVRAGSTPAPEQVRGPEQLFLLIVLPTDD